MQGESVIVVAERLGHENAALVLSTYGHLMPDSEERTRRAVDDAWSRVPRECPREEGKPVTCINVAVSDVEAELHHVAVGHHVVLALDADLARRPWPRPSTRRRRGRRTTRPRP